MKVVYVVTVPGAGPVTHLLTLTPAVRRAGLDVQVLCATEELVDAFTQVGVVAHAVPLRHKLDARGAASLWPHLGRIDVVHTHDRRAGLLARPLARLRGARIVHTFHGLPHEIAHFVDRPDAPLGPGVSAARAKWLEHGYLRLEGLLSRLGVVVVPSHAVADFLIEHGLDRNRIRVIANGIDVRRTEPVPAQSPLVVGTSGILEHRKGLDTLIAACAAADVPLRLEIYGDGSLRSELQQQATGLGVNATFHGEVSDVRDRLEKLDLFVLASRDENLPMALLEAMAAALPVVATRVGGVPELIEDGVSGKLVAPEDIDGLAAAITSMGSDEPLRERLARGASRRVADHFSDETMARAVVRLYEDVYSGKVPG